MQEAFRQLLHFIGSNSEYVIVRRGFGFTLCISLPAGENHESAPRRLEKMSSERRRAGRHQIPIRLLARGGHKLQEED